MIRGMVARLAGRLHDNGADVEGWLRLVRAYAVLGDRDKAKRRGQPTPSVRLPIIPTRSSGSTNSSKASVSRADRRTSCQNSGNHDP